MKPTPEKLVAETVEITAHLNLNSPEDAELADMRGTLRDFTMMLKMLNIRFIEFCHFGKESFLKTAIRLWLKFFTSFALAFPPWGGFRISNDNLVLFPYPPSLTVEVQLMSDNSLARIVFMASSNFPEIQSDIRCFTEAGGAAASLKFLVLYKDVTISHDHVSHNQKFYTTLRDTTNRVVLLVAYSTAAYCATD
ncbi:hypothetical protein T265_01529 [Opisthorchis viverrini]|uniref:Uncharacterized protein n=1 Tax=Opisthorchis viverrini TaxID=6198 RepID=A0A075A2K3_OPIVI|nr:hypothetical protein T265_01529 [Opisthorchis viverrini]KER32482.1 hypothetical protein T265_01529 [Opisthorchis viverrini]